MQNTFNEKSNLNWTLRDQQTIIVYSDTVKIGLWQMYCDPPIEIHLSKQTQNIKVCLRIRKDGSGSSKENTKT